MAIRGAAWRKRQIKMVERAQDTCINRAVERTDEVLDQAIDQVLDHFEKHGTYMAPTLLDLYAVSTDFYLSVFERAFACAEAAKTGVMIKPQAIKLSRRKKPFELPKTLKDLTRFFRDRRLWPRIMKNSKKTVDGLRKVYLKKLEQRFKKLLPRVLDGEISPKQARKELQDAWKQPKARVKTIFQTETANYFARAQKAYFANDPEIIGFLFDSVTDRVRTKICRSRHGLVYRPNTKLLEESTPALHYNCRSHLLPLANTPENRKLLEDPSRDPAKRRVEPLPRGWRK